MLKVNRVVPGAERFIGKRIRVFDSSRLDIQGGNAGVVLAVRHKASTVTGADLIYTHLVVSLDNGETRFVEPYEVEILRRRAYQG